MLTLYKVEMNHSRGPNQRTLGYFQQGSSGFFLGKHCLGPEGYSLSAPVQSSSKNVTRMRNSLLRKQLLSFPVILMQRMDGTTPLEILQLHHIPQWLRGRKDFAISPLSNSHNATLAFPFVELLRWMSGFQVSFCWIMLAKLANPSSKQTRYCEVW